MPVKGRAQTESSRVSSVAAGRRDRSEGCARGGPAQVRDAASLPRYPRPFAMLLAINPDHPEPRKVRRAVELLNDGGVIAYPTDTVYGIGCDLMNKHAIERLYAIKQMDRSHPLSFVCPISRTLRATPWSTTRCTAC